jgi:hypothetical protein
MYNFTGWFAAPYAPLEQRAAELWPAAAIVAVRTPFHGVALRAVDPHPCIEDDEARYIVQFGDPLLRLSQEFPQVTFVYLEAECFGGDCVYAGEVFRAGKVIGGDRGDQALTTLLHHLGVRLGPDKYFAPLDRGFAWGDAP